MDVTYKNLKTAIKPLLTLNKSFHLFGDSGIGKSAFVSQDVRAIYADILDVDADEVQILTINLFEIERADLAGYQLPVKTDEGLVTVQSKPPVFQRINKQFGILFLDESRFDVDMLSVASTLIHEKRIGVHQLPAGWQVISASNHVGSGCNTVPAPAHVNNRQCLFNVVPELREWLKLPRKVALHPVIQEVAMSNGSILNKIPDEDDKQFPTFRTLEEMSDLLRQIEASGDKYIPSAHGAIMHGCLGETIGDTVNELAKWAVNHYVPTTSAACVTLMDAAVKKSRITGAMSCGKFIATMVPYAVIMPALEGILENPLFVGEYRPAIVGTLCPKLDSDEIQLLVDKPALHN